MMKYQIPKEHYFRMYNKVFDLDLRATTFLVYSYLVCCAGGTAVTHRQGTPSVKPVWAVCGSCL